MSDRQQDGVSRVRAVEDERARWERRRAEEEERNRARGRDGGRSRRRYRDETDSPERGGGKQPRSAGSERVDDRSPAWTDSPSYRDQHHHHRPHDYPPYHHQPPPPHHRPHDYDPHYRPHDYDRERYDRERERYEYGHHHHRPSERDHRYGHSDGRRRGDDEREYSRGRRDGGTGGGPKAAPSTPTTTTASAAAIDALQAPPFFRETDVPRMLLDLNVLFGKKHQIDLGLEFDFEKDLVQTNVAGGFVPAQYEKGGEVCAFYLKGNCHRDTRCPYRHNAGAKATVCKHWLRGLCKKGPQCEFLHQYDMSKMPNCWFFGTYSECSNPECAYQHVVNELASKPCAWFARGFCKHGPTCRAKHIKKAACANYLTGFCPEGPNCKFGHPKYEHPKADSDPNSDQRRARMTCRACQQPGHAAKECPQRHNLPPDFDPYAQRPDGHHHHRSLDSVCCFKCGQNGHYADKCPNPKVPGVRRQFNR